MNLAAFFYSLKHWETWHHHVKYFPIAPAWAWHCIRSGSPWFFTASNPTLTFGGFEGEGKREMYEQLPPGTYPNTIYIPPGSNFNKVEKMVAEAGFSFPFIVKPNVGMMGFMFRKIFDVEQLKQYHETIPIEYLVQELIDYPLEISAFYYRMPNEQKGTISGFLKKEPPYIIGDSIKNIGELIEEHQGLKFNREEIITRHQERLHEVLPHGTQYYLSHASNRTQGGKLEGIDHEIDNGLQNLFDDLSHYSGKFLYGRYDIKCKSVADLKAGKNFSILEFNGAGAGTQHVYANNYTLWQACGIILHHWKVMARISRYNHQQGEKVWGIKEGWQHLKAAKKNLMMLKRMDATFPTFL